MAEIRPKIYESLVAGCPPVRLPSTWRFVQVDPDAHVVCPVGVLEHLREPFCDDELLRSRVAIRHHDELVLHPKLNTRERIVLTVRDKDARPCSLLTAAGDLHEDIPLFKLAQDVTVRNSLSRSGSNLFVAASLQDVVLLRSLGLPAAPATNLARLNRAGLQHFLWLVDGTPSERICKKRLPKFEIDQSGYSGSEDTRPAEFHVVLMGCELATGRAEVPAEIHAAARYLAKAEQSLEVIWDAVSVWWPTREELEQLDYRRQLADVDVVRDFFREPESLFGVSDFADPDKLPNREKTFVEIFDALLKAEREAQTHHSQHYDDNARQKRFEYYQRIDDQLFEPMIEKAIASGDQRILALRMELAHVIRIFQRAMPGHYAGFSSAVPSTGLLPESASKQLQTLVKMTIQLVTAEAHVDRKEGRAPGRWWPRS